MEDNGSPATTTLRTGRLLPGYVLLDDGVNAPMRGIASTDDGEIAVIAKKVGTRVLAVEALCAVYGRAAGLPIPEPLMIFHEEMGWMFGSADVGHPNLNRFVRLDSVAVRQKLLAWPDLLPAACFDELVVNFDRHDGNILFDGLDFTLIDHDLCIPHGMRADAAMPSNQSNELLDIIIKALPEGDLSKRKLLNDSNAWISEREEASAIAANDALAGVCTNQVKDQLVSFVKDRLPKLSGLLSAKINPDQGRFDI